MALLSLFEQQIGDLNDPDNAIRVIATVLFEVNKANLFPREYVLDTVLALINGGTVDLDKFIQRLPSRETGRLINRMKDAHRIAQEYPLEMSLRLKDPEQYKQSIIALTSDEDPLRQDIIVRAINDRLKKIVRQGSPRSLQYMVEVIAKIAMYRIALSRATMFRSLMYDDSLSLDDALKKTFSLEMLKLVNDDLKDNWKHYISLPKNMEA